MIIKWFGECSFCISLKSNFEIYIDPIDDILSSNSKIITISHYYPGLSINFLNSNPIIIDKPIKYTLDSLDIYGYSTFHDNMKGQKRGNNILYKFNMDNLNLCHLGHLGHMLDKNIISSLGKIDILLIPIGGNLTINSLEATKLINKLNPKIIIPMFYSTSIYMSYLDTLKSFLIYNKSLKKVFLPIFNTEDIYKYNSTTIVILKKHNYI